MGGNLGVLPAPGGLITQQRVGAFLESAGVVLTKPLCGLLPLDSCTGDHEKSRNDSLTQIPLGLAGGLDKQSHGRSHLLGICVDQAAVLLADLVDAQGRGHAADEQGHGELLF